MFPDDCLTLVVALVLILGTVHLWRFGDRWTSRRMSREDWDEHNRRRD